MKINIINEQEKKINEELVKHISEYIIKKEFKDGNFELNILITKNERIKEYNENYRHKTGPTDVLSFEYGLNEQIIGDIVISTEQIEKQASTFNNTFEEEFYYNIIHGVLHILGYDHETNEEDKRIMFEKQDNYFKKLVERGE